MPWLAHGDMYAVQAIRRDYAQALAEAQADPDDKSAAAHLAEQDGRRARAIRAVHRDDNASVRHLSAMFRCSKTTIRDILAADTD